MKLAVRTPSPPPPHRGGLRDSAIWYPTIPPQHLCLNEQSFLPRNNYTVGFKPLHWGHFGGPGGRYLQHLTGLSAVSSVGILRIHFYFDIEVPREHRSFGRLKLEEEYEETTNFFIDGPGGERIETVSMRYYYPTPETSMPGSDLEEYMGRCKVSCPLRRLRPTNIHRGRSLPCSFTQTAAARAASLISNTKGAASTRKSQPLRAPSSLACMPLRWVRRITGIMPCQIHVADANVV